MAQPSQISPEKFAPPTGVPHGHPDPSPSQQNVGWAVSPAPGVPPRILSLEGSQREPSASGVPRMITLEDEIL